MAIAEAQLRTAYVRRSGRTYFNVPWNGDRLLLRRDSLDIDMAMREILTGVYFDSDFAGRIVIDGGAHKGYYAVRALHHGAHVVYFAGARSLELHRDEHH